MLKGFVKEAKTSVIWSSLWCDIASFLLIYFFITIQLYLSQTFFWRQGSFRLLRYYKDVVCVSKNTSTIYRYLSTKKEMATLANSYFNLHALTNPFISIIHFCLQNLWLNMNEFYVGRYRLFLKVPWCKQNFKILATLRYVQWGLEYFLSMVHFVSRSIAL